MNINEQMHELGHMGSVTYAPSDDVVDRLLARTKRARAIRQGGSALVGTVGAIALGAITVQVIVATKNEPAFRDRNLIEDTSKLSSIFEKRYGGIPVNIQENTVDLAPIIESLNVAAQKEKELAELKRKEAEAAKKKAEEEAAAAAAAKKKAEQEAADKEKDKNEDKEGDDSCLAKYPYNKYPYKYKDCDTHKWITKNGYFEFGGDYFPVISWTDAATGGSATGNWISSHNKVAFAKPHENYVRDYKHFDSYTTWSGSTCVGKTKVKWNAPHQLSCLITNGGTEGTDWFLQDSAYKWLGAKGNYYLPSDPPSGWTWDGSAWVETA